MSAATLIHSDLAHDKALHNTLQAGLSALLTAMQVSSRAFGLNVEVLTLVR